MRVSRYWPKLVRDYPGVHYTLTKAEEMCCADCARQRTAYADKHRLEIRNGGDPRWRATYELFAVPQEFVMHKHLRVPWECRMFGTDVGLNDEVRGRSSIGYGGHMLIQRGPDFHDKLGNELAHKLAARWWFVSQDRDYLVHGWLLGRATLAYPDLDKLGNGRPCIWIPCEDLITARPDDHWRLPRDVAPD